MGWTSRSNVDVISASPTYDSDVMTSAQQFYEQELKEFSVSNGVRAVFSIAVEFEPEGDGCHGTFKLLCSKS